MGGRISNILTEHPLILKYISFIFRQLLCVFFTNRYQNFHVQFTLFFLLNCHFKKRVCCVFYLFEDLLMTQASSDFNETSKPAPREATALSRTTTQSCNSLSPHVHTWISQMTTSYSDECVGFCPFVESQISPATGICPAAGTRSACVPRTLASARSNLPVTGTSSEWMPSSSPSLP